MSEDLQKILNQIRAARADQSAASTFAKMAGDPLAKATFDQSNSPTTGLTYYDLEPGAKFLVPILTPLRNMIPRVTDGLGTQANWKAVTGINTAKLRAGVSQGNRGGVIDVTTADYNAVYRGLGLESNATFEAQYAAKGFDDVRARAALHGLQSLMIQEEYTILGGNTSLALGTTPTPSLVAGTTGGAIATSTISVICVALSFDAYINATVAGGLVGQISRTNADGSVDTFGSGAARKSTNATVSVTGPTGTVAATVAPVAGAVGYAWYWGTATNELLGAITTINSVFISGAATGTQNASAMPTVDYSTNQYVYDGLLTMIRKGLGSYVKVMATGTAGTGTPLTSDGAGGIVEIDEALKSFWDNYRLSPEIIWVNSQEAQNISRKILAGQSTSAQRFVFNVDQNNLGGGVMIRTYLNRFSMAGGQELKIMIHPNMPPGTIMFDCTQIPYPMADITNLRQVKLRQEYYQIEWPLRSRKYEYGVYLDGVLQHYFPPAMGMITNIANG